MRQLSRSPQVECADDETTNLLTNTKNTCSDASADQSSMDQRGLRSTNSWGLTLITVIVTLYMCNYNLSLLFMDEFLFNHYAKQVFGNRTVDTTKHPCVNETNGNTSSTDDITEVQALTSQKNLYLDLTSYGLGMIANLLLGTYSAVMSRRVLVVIPILGTLAKSFSVFVVILWDLDIDWCYAGYALEGICGNLCGMLFVGYLYTSDVTPRDKSRVVGMTILTGIKGAVPAGVNILAGWLIQDGGFVAPAGFCVASTAVAALLVIFLPDCKPRTLTKQTEELWTVRGSLKNMVHPFFFHKTRRIRYLAILGACSFGGLALTQFGVSKFRNLFYMHAPLCFDAITLGWFSFGREISYHLFCIVAVLLFYRCFPGVLLGMAGLISLAAGYLLYGFAVNRTQVFIGPAVAIAQSLAACVIRGEISRMLGPESQGPLFASFAVMESIGFAAGPPLFLSVYKASLTFYMPLTWILAAIFILMLNVPLGVFQVLWRKQVEEDSITTLTVQRVEEER